MDYRAAAGRYAEAQSCYETASAGSCGTELARREAYLDLYSRARRDAEGRLVDAILMLNGRRDPGADWDPCAFELDGTLYVVHQDGNEDMFRPVLVVLDAARHVAKG